MLKIWKGPEMEGNNLGEITLFVCSDKSIAFPQLKSILEVNPDISKIYLGAGRLAFPGFFDVIDTVDFLSYCKRFHLKLTIECEPAQLDTLLPTFSNAEIIVTIRTYRWNIADTKNIKLKLDDYNIARVFDNTYYDTDLKDVTDNKYSCDEILYEEV